jgi:hypothetical protein
MKHQNIFFKLCKIQKISCLNIADAEWEIRVKINSLAIKSGKIIIDMITHGPHEIRPAAPLLKRLPPRPYRVTNSKSDQVIFRLISPNHFAFLIHPLFLTLFLRHLSHVPWNFQPKIDIIQSRSVA